MKIKKTSYCALHAMKIIMLLIYILAHTLTYIITLWYRQWSPFHRRENGWSNLSYIWYSVTVMNRNQRTASTKIKQSGFGHHVDQPVPVNEPSAMPYVTTNIIVIKWKHTQFTSSLKLRFSLNQEDIIILPIFLIWFKNPHLNDWKYVENFAILRSNTLVWDNFILCQYIIKTSPQLLKFSEYPKNEIHLK